MVSSGAACRFLRRICLRVPPALQPDSLIYVVDVCVPCHVYAAPCWSFRRGANCPRAEVVDFLEQSRTGFSLMPHPADDGCCHLPSIPSRNTCVMPCAQSNIFSSKALRVIVQIGRCASKRCTLVSCAPPSPDTTTAAASVARPRGVDLHHNQGHR